MNSSHNFFFGLGRQDLPQGKVTHIFGQWAPIPPHHVQTLLLLYLSAMCSQPQAHTMKSQRYQLPHFVAVWIRPTCSWLLLYCQGTCGICSGVLEGCSWERKDQATYKNSAKPVAATGLVKCRACLSKSWIVVCMNMLLGSCPCRNDAGLRLRQQVQ